MKKLFTFLTALLLASASFAQQIPNNNFENWQTKVGIGFTGPYTYEIPQSWELGFVSELLTSFGMKPNVGKGGATNNFALQLKSTADTVGSDVQAAFGLPVNSAPDGLVGKFKTSGVVTDSDDYGNAFVFMTKWNGVKRDTIGFGAADLTSSPNGFTTFQVPIQYMGAQPDSAIIYFLYFPNEGNTNILIDDLSFVSLLSTEKEIAAANRLQLFPNPVTDKATLTFNARQAGKGTLIIRDMVGKELKTLPLVNLAAGNNTIPVETTGLKNGLYTITLQTEKGTQTLRFLKH